jgi:60 kDa SS-A/Ro ribonucleoprotein
MAHANLLNLKARAVSCERPSIAIISPEIALRRTVLADLLSESQFCEPDATLADRIASLVPQVDAAAVAALAVESRERMQLCFVPLLLVREMARHASHRALVGATLARVIQHANEISDFVAIYWSNGR